MVFEEEATFEPKDATHTFYACDQCGDAIDIEEEGPLSHEKDSDEFRNEVTSRAEQKGWLIHFADSSDQSNIVCYTCLEKTDDKNCECRSFAIAGILAAIGAGIWKIGIHAYGWPASGFLYVLAIVGLAMFSIGFTKLKPRAATAIWLVFGLMVAVLIIVWASMKAYVPNNTNAGSGGMPTAPK